MISADRKAELRQMYEKGITYQRFCKLPVNEQCQINIWAGEDYVDGIKKGLADNETVEMLKNEVKNIIRLAYK